MPIFVVEQTAVHRRLIYLLYFPARPPPAWKLVRSIASFSRSTPARVTELFAGRIELLLAPPPPRRPQGWKLVGLKLVTPGRPLVESHYEEHAGKVGL